MENAIFLAALERAERILLRALEGLTREELMAQPMGPGSNPVGWLAWHLTWVQDMYVSGLEGREQMWVTDGWCTRFGMEPTPRSFTPQDVHTFDPKDVETLLGYYQAVKSCTTAYASRLAPEELDREVLTRPGQPPTNVAGRLGGLLSDNIQHIGQIAYPRGAIREQGWYGV